MPAPPASITVARRRVLLAEDNPTNRLVAARMLERMGHDVTAVADGAAAVAAVSQKPFDIAFIDCQMPEVDGYEATRSIRRLPPPAGEIPIVALTAGAFASHQALARAAGMDEYLAKPVDWGTVPMLIARLTGGSAVQADDAGSDGVVLLDEKQVRSLEDLAAGRSSLLLELISTFESDARAAVVHLTSATTEGRGADLAGVVHRLSGSASTFGAAQLTDLCRILQQVDPGSEQAGRIIEQLPDALEAALTALHLRLGLG